MQGVKYDSSLKLIPVSNPFPVIRPKGANRESFFAEKVGINRRVGPCVTNGYGLRYLAAPYFNLVITGDNCLGVVKFMIGTCQFKTFKVAVFIFYHQPIISMTKVNQSVFIVKFCRTEQRTFKKPRKTINGGQCFISQS